MATISLNTCTGHETHAINHYVAIPSQGHYLATSAIKYTNGYCRLTK